MVRPHFVVRQLYAAPDDETELLASTSSGAVLHLRVVADSSTPQVVTAVPPLELPGPATDLVWCPFKKGKEGASFLTTSTNLPLQMWDLDDGAQRATYTDVTDAGYMAQPLCALWSAKNNATIAAGYGGGSEDTTQLRFYDVRAEGAPVFKYKSPTSRGAVAAVAEGPSGATDNLVVASFRAHGILDVVDHRQRTPAAMLHGKSIAANCLRTHAALPFAVFAGSRDAIQCWDLRRPQAVWCTYDRPTSTAQRCGFELLRGRDGGGLELVSSTTGPSGGLVQYVVPVAEPSDSNVRLTGKSFHASVGPTSGLAVLAQQRKAAVVLGTRHFQLPASLERTGAATPCPADRESAKSGRSDERAGKRPRSEDVPLSDTEEGDAMFQAPPGGHSGAVHNVPCSDTVPNVVVLSL